MKCMILKNIVFSSIKSKEKKRKKRKINIYLLGAGNARCNSSVKSDSCALVVYND